MVRPKSKLTVNKNIALCVRACVRARTRVCVYVFVNVGTAGEKEWGETLCSDVRGEKDCYIICSYVCLKHLTFFDSHNAFPLWQLLQAVLT